MIKGIVVAGSYEQYLNFMNIYQYNPKEYIYVSKPSDLCGLHNTKIIYTGEYWKNPIYYNVKRLQGEIKREKAFSIDRYYKCHHYHWWELLYITIRDIVRRILR